MSIPRGFGRVTEGKSCPNGIKVARGAIAYDAGGALTSVKRPAGPEPARTTPPEAAEEPIFGYASLDVEPCCMRRYCDRAHSKDECLWGSRH